MNIDLLEQKEKLKRLERAFVGAVSSALNYDSKEWVFNDKGRLHAITSSFLNETTNHDNGLITLALARYQSNYFEPVPLKIPSSTVFKTSVDENIYYEYNPTTGSFLVPSKKQIINSNGDTQNNIDLANAVENTHFNASLYASTKMIKNNDVLENTDTLHLVFRGTEQGFDSVLKKYGIDAYTDLDKYYRQMEVFEKSIFEYIEQHPNIKEFTVTGHSLGGAMAEFFYEKNKKFFDDKNIKFYATTFGSPGADMKPWFSSLKDKFRSLRESIDFVAKNNVILSDYIYEKHSQKAQEEKANLFNPDSSILSKTKSFFSMAFNSTLAGCSVVVASINNKINDIVSYHRVSENNIFKNNDSAENKADYSQEHYFHKHDPIPKVGGFAYNKNGQSYLLHNYLREQNGANKFFKKIMGEHTSDGYIHNIVNEIQKVYNENPELKMEMFKLNPAYRAYIDGYNIINANKELYQKEVSANPELKEILMNNMFNASRHNMSRTFAGSVSDFKEALSSTKELIKSIKHDVSIYEKTISPITKENQKLDVPDYSDGVLPLPSGHKISPITMALSEKYKTTFVVPQDFNMPPEMIKDNFKLIKEGRITSFKNTTIELSNKTQQLLNSNISHNIDKNNHDFSNLVQHSIECVSGSCTHHVSTLTTLKTYSVKGNLQDYLFTNRNESCDLQPDLNLETYNVKAVQSFHSKYTGNKLSVSAFLAEKLGFTKSDDKVGNVISQSQAISEHGMTKDNIELFSQSLDDFLKKPEVLANMQKVLAERERLEISELKQRNTLQL